MLLAPPAYAQTAADIAVISQETDNYAYITHGSAGSTTESWAKKLGENQDITFLSGNFDGSGSDDLACIDFDSSNNPYAFILEGPGDDDATKWNTALRSNSQVFYYFLPGDYNGDGSSDLATFYRYYGGASPTTDIRAKITYGPDASTQSSDGDDWDLAGELSSALMSGLIKDSGSGNDSYADVVAISPNGANYTANIYIGPDGDASGSWAISPPSDTDATNDPTPVQMGTGDFDGDGNGDVVMIFYDATPGGDPNYKARIAYGPNATLATWNLSSAAFVSIQIGDFSGDGKTDIAGITDDNAGTRTANIFSSNATSGNRSAAPTSSSWSLEGDATMTTFLSGDFDRLTSTISGTVYRKGGTVPLQGATVTLAQAGESDRTIVTGSGGTYSFGNITNGTYTVSATKGSHDIDPVAPFNGTIVINNASSANNNFVSTNSPLDYTISGKVTSVNSGSGMAGMTVTAVTSDGGFSASATKSVTTDSSGNYTINVTLGTYTVTPSHPDDDDFEFSPTSRSVSITTASVANVNFSDTGEDLCIDDPDKTAPGVCGCGVADTDTDGDGFYDCQETEQCPNNTNKQTPGECGCDWDRENEDLNENGVADCNEEEGELYSVSGKLYIENDLQEKVPFFDEESAINQNILDIWVEGTKHTVDGGKISVGRVKVNRSSSTGALSSFKFNNLPGTPLDENGNPQIVIIRDVERGVDVEHAVGGYTFVIKAYDNKYSVSRDFKMNRIAARAAGCQGISEDTEDADKPVFCRFDPLVVDQDLEHMDQLVNGCIHDTDKNGNIVERQMGKDRTCFVSRTRDGDEEDYMPTSPLNLTATKGSRGDGVYLRWTAAQRVDYYRVLRSQYPEETNRFRRAYEARIQGNTETVLEFNGESVNSQLFPSGSDTQTMTFLDTTAVPGVHYDYVVRAYNPAGAGGFSNAAEGWRSKNEDDSDSDGDGVTDEQEEEDGTDKFDPGSLVKRLRSPAYTKYNTFLSQLNWLELIATGTAPVNAAITVYDSAGNLRTLYDAEGNPFEPPYFVAIPAGNQFDIDIHRLVRDPDIYGVVRVDFNADDPGVQLQGRMTMYRENPNQDHLQVSDRMHSFAFTRELRNPTRGASYATGNTYDPQGLGNLVPNWAEIINLDSVDREFTQRLYDMEGNLIFDSDRAYDENGNRLPPIVVPAYGEVDVQAGHEFGENVYLIEILPKDGATKYFSTSVRYSSNAQGGGEADTYNFAMPITAKRGTGDRLFVPINNRIADPGACWTQTNWVEIINAREKPVSAQVIFRDETGSEVGSTVVYLRELGQEHLNASALLNLGQIGQVEIIPSDAGSLIAQSNTYFHDCEENRTQTAYSSDAKIPGVPAQVGSFNRFYGMDNMLRIMNTTPEVVNYDLELIQSDNSLFEQHVISPYVTIENNLSDGARFQTNPNSYGPLKVTTPERSKLSVENVRAREVDGRMDFAIPTTVK